MWNALHSPGGKEGVGGGWEGVGGGREEGKDEGGGVIGVAVK